MQSGPPPPALAALDAEPLLLAAVEGSLTRQVARIVERAAGFQGRASLLAALDARVQQHAPRGGLIALDAPPGTGATTLLAHLAATRRAAFWFADEDAGQGAEALAAQLIALHTLDVPLIPPAIATDPAVLVALLNAVSQQATPTAPALLLLDLPASQHQPRSPLPLVLPDTLPPHVVALAACAPGMAFPCTPVAHLALPQQGEVADEQAALLRARGTPAVWHTPLIEAAGGSYLYLRLAAALLHAGVLTRQTLAPGVESLYNAWWGSLDSGEQHLALLLAAAGDYFPTSLAHALLENDAAPRLQRMEQAGVIEQVRLVRIGTGDLTEEDELPFAALTHESLRDYLATTQPDALRNIHTHLAALAWEIAQQSSSLPPLSRAAMAYCLRQFARHAALGSAETHHTLLPRVAERAWIRAQERRSGKMADAAHDVLWALWGATRNDHQSPDALLRLAHTTLLAGTLVSLARPLTADAAVHALHVALERIGRESGLKRVLEVVEQLPDGRPKAHILRMLGETCYSARMRTSAMRLLSQALDLEEQPVPQAWREQRDRLLLAMVDAALAAGAVDTALDICDHFIHREQRGMAETHVVRYLQEHGELVRARRVACNIMHDNLSAWAQAEVAVAEARSGSITTAEMLLDDVTIDTARAWAHIEIACLIAQHDGREAQARIERLDNESQHDQGLNRLSQALAFAGDDEAALHVAGLIGDVNVRVSALINLRHVPNEPVALRALENASAAIGEMPYDQRVPMVALLASAYASLGQRARAIATATEQTSSSEERDRALSRVAVALAQFGDHSEALAITRGLSDNDERDWTLDELSHVLADAGYWQEAQARAREICDDRDRARALSNLSITLGRLGAPLAALHLLRSITSASERARALIFIAPMLVGAGYSAEALAVLKAERSRTREQSADVLLPMHVSRYMATIAAALAEQGNLERACDLAREVRLPHDRARVYLAVARAATDPARTSAMLGTALLLAVQERGVAFRLVEQALPALTRLGGAPLLHQLALALADMESWW